jgi:hypothetical protein
MIKEYHKIETLFERDIETKKLIIGKYRNPTVEFLKDAVWQFTEKVDGTNIRVHWDGHKVSFAGRTDRAQIPSHLLSMLEKMFGGEVNEQIFEQTFGEKEVTLYGEGYGHKIQTNGYLHGEVDFALFDVMVGDIFLARKDVVQIAQTFYSGVVPIIFEGTLEEGIYYVKQHPKSIVGLREMDFNKAADMEGLVARPKVEMRDRLGNRVIVKIKYNDFKEE